MQEGRSQATGEDLAALALALWLSERGIAPLDQKPIVRTVVAAMRGDLRIDYARQAGIDTSQYHEHAEAVATAAINRATLNRAKFGVPPAPYAPPELGSVIYGMDTTAINELIRIDAAIKAIDGAIDDQYGRRYSAVREPDPSDPGNDDLSVSRALARMQYTRRALSEGRYSIMLGINQYVRQEVKGTDPADPDRDKYRAPEDVEPVPVPESGPLDWAVIRSRWPVDDNGNPLPLSADQIEGLIGLGDPRVGPAIADALDAEQVYIYTPRRNAEGDLEDVYLPID